MRVLLLLALVCCVVLVCGVVAEPTPAHAHAHSDWSSQGVEYVNSLQQVNQQEQEVLVRGSEIYGEQPRFQQKVGEGGSCSAEGLDAICARDCSEVGGGSMWSTACEGGLNCCVKPKGAPKIKMGGKCVYDQWAGYNDGTCQPASICGKSYPGEAAPTSNCQGAPNMVCCLEKPKVKEAEFRPLYSEMYEAKQRAADAAKERAEAERRAKMKYQTLGNQPGEAPRDGPFTFNDKPSKPMQTLGNQPEPVRDGPFTFNNQPSKPLQTLGNQPQPVRDGPFTFNNQPSQPMQTLGNQPQPIKNGPFTFQADNSLEQTLCPIDVSLMEMEVESGSEVAAEAELESESDKPKAKSKVKSKAQGKAQGGDPYAGLTPAQIKYCKQQRAAYLKAKAAKAKAAAKTASPANNAADIAHLKKLIQQNRSAIRGNKKSIQGKKTTKASKKSGAKKSKVVKAPSKATSTSATKLRAKVTAKKAKTVAAKKVSKGAGAVGGKKRSKGFLAPNSIKAKLSRQE